MERKAASGIMVATLLIVAFVMGLDVGLSFESFSTTKVCVDPPYYFGTHVSETFVININITDVANLYGFEYRLTWNGTLIKLIKVEIFLPWSPYFIAKNETGVLPNGKTYYWLGASALHSPIPWSGSMIVTKLTFRIMYQPYYPESDLSTKLDLGVPNPPFPTTEAFSRLADSVPSPILHEVYSGLYEIKTILLQPDINLDGIVDILDVIIWANAFGSKPEDPSWNPYVDLYHDNIIDIFDGIIIAQNYGKTYS